MKNSLIEIFLKNIFLPVLTAIIICFESPLSADENHNDDGDWAPFQLSLFNPVQIFNEKSNIYGLRLNVLYGVNRDVIGLDLGLVNKAEDVYGAQLGIIRNLVKGDMGGCQLGIANDVDGSMILVQTALYRNLVKDNMYGIQTALIDNRVEGRVFGMQTAIRENVSGDFSVAIQTALRNNMARGRLAGYRQLSE
jgi:hypothetical protein